MAAQQKPKVLLFDIGGVCVVSPFKAILEYEIAHNIPTGYINYCIRALTPNGAWHKLERGEILLDAAYFAAWKRELEDPAMWREYILHQQAKTQASQSGGSNTANQPSTSTSTSTNTNTNTNTNTTTTIPPVPSINTEEVYWTMMSTARTPDPYMYPALKKLRASGAYHLAALSNTTIFPADAPIPTTTDSREDVKAVFAIFVSSAHVGMRKPSPDIYQYTLRLLRERWGRDLRAQDVLFLDDIGENLKTARALGMRTLRVFLGRTREAVEELERVTGLQLLEGDGKEKARL